MILVVGDVMTDVVVRPTGPLQPGSDTPAGIVIRPGGSGANIACWLGHLGGNAAFAGRVGRGDAASHAAALRLHGVRARLAADPVRETGRVVALIDAAGERSFYTDRGANLALCADDLPPSLLEGCAWLHVSGHTLLGPPQGREAARALMRAARSRGLPVSVDAGSPVPLRAAGREAFVCWTADATACFCNEAEATVLGAGPAHFGHFVVTRGAAGAEAWIDGVRATAAAMPAVALDSTGAGDAFTAAALLGLRRGAPPMRWLADATAAGACATALPGGRPASVPA